MALSDAVCVVDSTQDGSSALQTLVNEEHQVALFSLGLPKRDGFEALRRLRQIGNAVPITTTLTDGLEYFIKGLGLITDVARCGFPLTLPKENAYSKIFNIGDMKCMHRYVVLDPHVDTIPTQTYVMSDFI